MKIALSTVLLLAMTLAPGKEIRLEPAMKDPVTKAFRFVLQRQTNSLVWSAKAMPAEKYGFRPTSQQLTFSQIIAKVIKDNYHFCSAAAEKPAPVESVDPSEGKEKLIHVLSASFDFCKQSLVHLHDRSLGDTVHFSRETWGGRSAALFGLVEAWADRYRQAAQYLRLNGLDTPTAAVRD